MGTLRWGTAVVVGMAAAVATLGGPGGGHPGSFRRDTPVAQGFRRPGRTAVHAPTPSSSAPRQVMMGGG